MRVPILFGVVSVLFVVVVILGFRVIEASLELDGLKSQVTLQREGMDFLETVANTSIENCSMSVAEFERIARTYSGGVTWQDNSGLVGPFRVTKKDSCIEGINLVGL